MVHALGNKCKIWYLQDDPAIQRYIWICENIFNNDRLELKFLVNIMRQQAFAVIVGQYMYEKLAKIEI